MKNTDGTESSILPHLPSLTDDSDHLLKLLDDILKVDQQLQLKKHTPPPVVLSFRSLIWGEEEHDGSAE